MVNIILLIVCFLAGVILKRTGRFPAATLLGLEFAADRFGRAKPQGLPGRPGPGADSPQVDLAGQGRGASWDGDPAGAPGPAGRGHAFLGRLAYPGPWNLP